MLALLSLSISHSLQPSVESADAPLPGALYLDATFAAKSSSSLCAKGTSGKGCKTVALSPDGPALPRAPAGEATAEEGPGEAGAGEEEAGRARSVARP